MLKVLGLALYGPLAASHRVRLRQYREGLAKAGIDLRIQGLFGDDYLKASFEGRRRPFVGVFNAFVERVWLLANQEQFDVVIVHCELFPFTPGWVDLTSLRIPFVYDFDDAFYLRYQIGNWARLNCLLGGKLDQVMRGASAITAGNDHLAAYARALNKNVTVVPSVVDTKKFAPGVHTESSKFTIGWIGSSSTATYLQALVEPLQTLVQGRQLKLVVIGGKAPHIEGVEVIETAWSECTEVMLINTFDVGVMPLPDNEWACGKCAYKLIQYMACGVPVVASRVGANINVVTKDCGFLVSNATQWVDALTQLYEQPLMRQKMGASCRRRVKSYYSLDYSLPILSSVIHALIEKKRN